MTSEGWTREEMARRTAQDIPDGSYVNLGIGIPEMVAQFVPEGREFIYQTENGLLGMGPAPEADTEDRDLINAGKKTVTTVPGASFFHHADSFVMIRGGHIDICVANAGVIAGPGFTERRDYTDDDWDATQSVNLRGGVNTNDAVNAPLIERGAGRSINLASQ